ncbi:MAG: hypothetical protein HY905_10180 [Deltaproteobacteria bacterium]|nr:hypothetical protein [Deltaproteobacteria bacterium]
MVRSAALVPVLLALVGCAKDLIPNTEVENTSDNRDVIDFCEQYRIALEAKDFAKIVALTADDYYEDGASPPGNDDYDRVGLQARLAGRFARVEEVRYDIRYRRVVYFPDRVEVYYSFYGRFQVSGAVDDESRWFSEVGDNRLVLRRTPDGYKILSGL